MEEKAFESHGGLGSFQNLDTLGNIERRATSRALIFKFL